MPAPDVATFHQVTRPTTNENGLYAPGLRFGDPRVMAVLASLVGFCHILRGFTNRELVQQVSALRDMPYNARKATYDLRRLARKHLIAKIPNTNRYQLTKQGRRIAVLFTKVYGRVLAPSLTVLDLDLPNAIARKSPLAIDWRRFNRTLNDFMHKQAVAA